MMGDLAIKAEGLGKRYRLGERERYVALRDVLARGFRRMLRQSGERGPRQYVWALRNVSFDVREGTALGIIGANGAGKSTLLKVLSRITRPTEGWAELHGRVGSLLEVGTGFHPELTGSENVYMNGAILGMRRREIEAKFDDIVEFAELARFMQTPVKHYSSGMYVRLAFAVAAHLEPEIFLIDEVLAVGDANFQRKCLGKMDDVAHEGRTVLFVSHNMPAITRLCSEALWIHDGRIRLQGPADRVVKAYLETVSHADARRSLPARVDQAMCLRQVAILDARGQASPSVEMGEPFWIVVRYDINREVSGAHVITFVSTMDGVNLLGTGDADTRADRLGARQPGSYVGRVQIPAFLLGEGRYTVTVSMGVPYVQVFDRHENVVSFDVFDASSQRREWQHRRRPGLLGVELDWEVERVAPHEGAGREAGS